MVFISRKMLAAGYSANGECDFPRASCAVVTQ